MSESVDEYGIPRETVATTASSPLLIGRRKMFAGLLAVEWAFLTVTTVNIAATLGMTSYRLYEVISLSRTDSADFTLCILLLINTGFCAFYLINGLLREQEFEIYALMAAIVVVVGYCTIEYSINKDGRSVIKLARLIVVWVAAPINILLAFFVARGFGWLEFRIVGACQELQYAYEQVCRFTSFLKFDFQIAVSMVVLVLKTGADVSQPEVIVLSVGLPLCLIWMLFGVVMVRKEWRWAVPIFIIVGLLEPAYVVYKLYMVYSVDLKDLSNLKVLSEVAVNMVLEYAVIIVGLLSLLVRAVILYELYVVVRNFGEGLVGIAFNNREHTERTALLRGQPARERLPYM